MAIMLLRIVPVDGNSSCFAISVNEAMVTGEALVENALVAVQSMVMGSLEMVSRRNLTKLSQEVSQ